MNDKVQIHVLYRGNWYWASSVSIGHAGELDIEYCYGFEGTLDSEHIERIEVFPFKVLKQKSNNKGRKN